MPWSGSEELRNFKQTVGEPLKEIWSTNVPRLVFILFLHVLAVFALLGSFIPELMTNYFANLKTGEDVLNCAEKQLSETATMRCRDARDQVLLWKSGESIVAYLIVGVLLSPSLGRWSDYWGRKAFICIGLGVGVLIPLSILLNLQFGEPLWWFYPAKIVVVSVNPFPPTFAYVADVVSPPSRTIAYALTGIVFGLAYAIGPMLVTTGAIPEAAIACYVGIALVVISCAMCALLVPESLSEEIMESSKATLELSLDKTRTCAPRVVVGAVVTFWGSFSILFRNDLFQKLTLCIFVLYINFEEVFDMEAQYFQEVAHFGTQDLAMLFSIAGVCGLLTITVGVWIMVSLLRMNDKSILLLGMLTLAFQQIMYTFARQKTAILIATGIGTVANLVFPAINSIKSRNIGADQQGALQGAIASAQSVAKGIGPILFLLLFKIFRSKVLYFPGAPFFVGFLLLMVAIVFAFTLKITNPSVGSKRDLALFDKHPLLKSHSVALSSMSSEDY